MHHFVARIKTMKTEPYLYCWTEKVFRRTNCLRRLVRLSVNTAHIKDNAAHKNNMELSKEYWKIKQQNRIPRIKWKVLRKFHAYDQKKKTVYPMPK